MLSYILRKGDSSTSRGVTLFLLQTKSMHFRGYWIYIFYLIQRPIFKRNRLTLNGLINFFICVNLPPPFHRMLLLQLLLQAAISFVG